MKMLAEYLDMAPPIASLPKNERRNTALKRRLSIMLKFLARRHIPHAAHYSASGDSAFCVSNSFARLVKSSAKSIN